MTRLKPKGVGLGDLFFREPDEWGLRGDPYLWAEMRSFLADRPLPSSREELSDAVTSAFQELTGHPLVATRDSFAIERFAHGGMSSGHIDPAWWRSKALPLLSARLSAYRDDAARYREILESVLVKRPRRLPSGAVSAFIDAAAQELAGLADSRRWVKEQMPEDWDKDYDGSQRSLESLARGLRRQTPFGRRALLKQAIESREGHEALRILATGETADDWDGTIDSVVELILAAANPPGENPTWKLPVRAEEVSRLVTCMARLWSLYLKKEPKAADGAPFSDAVIAVWAELSGRESLSWKSVGHALRNFEHQS